MLAVRDPFAIESNTTEDTKCPFRVICPFVFRYCIKNLRFAANVKRIYIVKSFYRILRFSYVYFNLLNHRNDV